MNMFLILATALSFAVAATLSVLYWRLTRIERRRSDARVEALLDAVANFPQAASPQLAPASNSNVIDELVLRPFSQTRDQHASIVGDERAVSRPQPAQLLSRSSERIGDQTVQDREISVQFMADESQGSAAFDLTETAAGGAVAAHDLFHEAAEPQSGFGRLLVPVSLGVVIVGIILSGILMLNHARAGDGRSTGTPAVSEPAASAPLELISLRHQRTAGGLSITGLVRNPAIGHRVTGLTVVVQLFDRNGALATSATGPLDFRTLAPGDESPFTISLDNVGAVGRYRVSFRADDKVVPHVDRRQDSSAVAASLGNSNTPENGSRVVPVADSRH